VPAVSRIAGRNRYHLLLALPLLGGCYFVKQGLAQIEILSKAQPIDEVLKNRPLTLDQRESLQLVQEIKKFAEERIGMTPTENFTTYYDPGERPITYTVIGCRKDRFEPHLWHFSFLGPVPYKGFFSREDAEQERRRLEEKGYDTVVQGVGAYSTLGYFKDPVLAYHLRYTRAGLTALILHELSHSSVYAPGHTDFNESMAEFVAGQAGLEFLTEKYRADSPEVAEFIEERADSALYESFIEGLYGMLDALYRSGGSTEEKLSRRTEIFTSAQEEFERLKSRFKRRRYESFDRGPLNNAFILARRMYMRLPYWQSVYERVGRAWPAFWNVTREAAKAPRPFSALDELIRRVDSNP
jgi:predicted aminopeptidase